MAIPGLRDVEDELLAEIRRLNNNIEQENLGTTVNQTINQGGEAGDENQPVYYSSGPNPVKIDNANEFEEIEFGFTAHSLNLRTTDAVVLSFVKPSIGGGVQIHVAGEESPFTIGGESGIDADRVYLKKSASATDDPLVQIIAYK